MEKTWTIRDWNCKTQSYDAPREVTLAQFKAENARKCAEARAIHRANIQTVERESR